MMLDDNPTRVRIREMLNDHSRSVWADSDAAPSREGLVTMIYDMIIRERENCADIALRMANDPYLTVSHGKPFICRAISAEIMRR